MDELLTIAEIARQLNIPESNLRYYRDKYIEYIPYVGTGKKRKYKHEAIAIFAYVAELVNEGKTAIEVAMLLDRRNTKTVDIVNETATTTTTTPQIDIFQVLASHQQKIDDLSARQHQLEQQLNNHYKLVDERLRQISLKPKPWWKIWLKTY